MKRGLALSILRSAGVEVWVIEGASFVGSRVYPFLRVQRLQGEACKGLDVVGEHT